MATSDDLQRLGAYIRAARSACGLTSTQAAAQASISPTTLGEIERGTSAPRRALTYAAIEKVVGWAPGSVSQILAGGEPTPLAGPAHTADPADRIAAWENELISEIWNNPHLTMQEREELTERTRVKAAEARAIQDRLRRAAG